MAQNGSASGSLADNAAVPSPWALKQLRRISINAVMGHSSYETLQNLHTGKLK